MKLNIAQLREKAEKATKGPWTTEGGMELFVFGKDHNGELGVMIAEMRGVGAGQTDEQMADNARFIAAFNPETVLELLRQHNVLMGALEDVLTGDSRTTVQSRDRARQAIKDCEGE